MIFKKIAVLTSKQSWFVRYARNLVTILKGKGYKAKLFFRHEDIDERYQIVFVLSYFRLISEDCLKKRKHNLVIHESDLPKGRGWSPLFWQILEGKNIIPIVLFEVNKKMDEGDIYIKDFIVYEGHELHNELREKQALKTIELCSKFLDEYEHMKPVSQKGKAAYYKKRTFLDSKLDIRKSLKDQFNLLRTVNNEDFPAFFIYKGCKYIVKIDKVP
jgi:methionyl-tRNA formyltransferase